MPLGQAEKTTVKSLMTATFIRNSASTTTVKTLPSELVIPGLTACERVRYRSNTAANSIHYLTDAEDASAAYEARIDSYDFDIDGGEAESWALQLRSDTDTSATAWNTDCRYADNDYISMAELEQNELRTSTHELLDYCSMFDGYNAAEVEALQVYDDQYIYLDWLNCVRSWKAEMPAELAERTDWENLNPNRYIIQENGTLQLIS